VFSAENGVKYYLDNGEELTLEEIQSSLNAEGMRVEAVGEIWGPRLPMYLRSSPPRNSLRGTVAEQQATPR